MRNIASNASSLKDQLAQLERMFPGGVADVSYQRDFVTDPLGGKHYLDGNALVVTLHLPGTL